MHLLSTLVSEYNNSDHSNIMNICHHTHKNVIAMQYDEFEYLMNSMLTIRAGEHKFNPEV